MTEEPRATVRGRTFRLPVQVRFGDTDALGHVNNAVYASYAELGRISMTRDLGVRSPSFILARLAIDFRRQVRLGDEVYVETEVTKVGNSSVTMFQRLLAESELAADMEAVVVWFDYASQRPARLPDEVRTLFGG